MKIKSRNNKCKIIADNGRIFSISSNVRSKIGSIVKFMEAYRFATLNGFDSFKNFLNHQNSKIIAYKYYWKIAMFLAINNRLINFHDLHIVNTDLNLITRDDRKWREVPIYYKKCYTSANPYNNSCQTNQEKRANEEVYALKYKPNKKFDNKVDIKKNNENRKECVRYYSVIKNEFLHILKSGHKVAVASIPSSTKGVITVIDHIINDISVQKSNIVDASNLFIRIKNKVSAHNRKGIKSRSIVQNINTLTVSKKTIEKIKSSNVESIVILDDVTTTGSSFIAVDHLLRKYHSLDEFPIINLAYAHVVHGYYINPDKINTNVNNDNSNIKGAIFDVDNTLVRFCDHITDRNKYNDSKDYRSILNKSIPNKDRSDVLLFNFIDYLLSKDIKVSLISDLGQVKLDDIINDEDFSGKLSAISSISNRVKVNNSNPYSSYEYNYVYRAKPSPYWVLQAIKNMGLNQDDRIIGVGNQEEDIMTYHQAGLDPVLVTWFNNNYDLMGTPDHNPVPFVNYKCGRIKTFNHIYQFIRWFDRRNIKLRKDPFRIEDF